MAISEPAARPARPTTAPAGATAPVAFFAAGGALVLAFIAYVWLRWVTGPNFERVPAGPSDQPEWMTVVQWIWQPVGLVAAAVIVWRCVIRPWRRDGRPGTDGLLVLGFCTLWFQDPLSGYFGHWFTYNANLVNFGAWTLDVPGWMSQGAPGAMVLEPILLIGPIYVYFILFAAIVGCWVMRTIKARRPQTKTWQLVIVCFLAMCTFDAVGEGLIFLPLGFWEYPGGYGLFFIDTYHKYPVNEMLTIGALLTSISCLRYFRDDRGRTVVERGVDRIRSPRRQTVARVLAMTFAVHAILFLTYNVPHFWVGANSAEWPADLQKRSYLLNGICGEGTDRACPGPGVPNVDGNTSPYMDRQGRMVVPAGNQDPPPAVPVDRGGE